MRTGQCGNRTSSDSSLVLFPRSFPCASCLGFVRLLARSLKSRAFEFLKLARVTRNEATCVERAPAELRRN